MHHNERQRPSSRAFSSSKAKRKRSFIFHSQEQTVFLCHTGTGWYLCIQSSNPENFPRFHHIKQAEKQLLASIDFISERDQLFCRFVGSINTNNSRI